MWEAVALSFGLAMDATAVSAARGLAARRNEVIILPLLFGIFQAGMSALGWAAGAWGGPYFRAYDHWVGFGLLVLVGGKMLVEALRGGEDAHENDDRSRLGVYLLLSLATSIDAAAAGITLPLLSVSPVVAISLIGAITFACAFAGHWLGRIAGKHLGQGLEVVGGVVLIAIGVRVLVQGL